MGAFTVEGMKGAEGISVCQSRCRVENAQLIAERRQQTHQRALDAHNQPHRRMHRCGLKQGCVREATHASKFTATDFFVLSSVKSHGAAKVHGMAHATGV